MIWGRRRREDRPDVDRLLDEALRELNEAVAELQAKAREIEESDDRR